MLDQTIAVRLHCDSLCSSNPKHETLNPKQFPNRKLKLEIPYYDACLEHFIFLFLNLFRISKLGFRIILLNILHLLADAFEFGLEGHHLPGDVHSVGLGADGIDFTEQLLAQKIECAAGWFDRAQ